MNLRHVEICDFRKSELTNLEEIIARNKHLRTVGQSDLVILINIARTQIVMLGGFALLQTNVKYLRSEKIRLLNGEVWDPLRLAAYARQVGIRITNFHIITEVLNGLQHEVAEGWKMAS